MATASFIGSSLRGWRLWIVIAVAVEVLWFALLYPLVPRSALGALIELALPLPIAGYIYLIVQLLFWLSDRTFSAGVRRLLGIALVASVGLVIFLLLYGAQRLFSADFGRGLVA
jgi:pheromone shutdown protein TraB